MKNKFIKYSSVTCLIIFSMFSFLLNFSFTPKAAAIKIEEQKQLEIIMEKEKPTIEALACWNSTTKTAEIKSKANFNEIRNAVNSGTTFSGYTITLNADIDFDGEAFVPVGSMVGSTTRYFSGIFNGNGHSLKNIKITSNTTNICGDIGVFGYVSGGTIKNLTVVIDTITLTTANKSMGGLVGSISGKVTIQNCILLSKNSSSKICTSNTTADVSMNSGGFVGYCNATSGSKIEQCANFVPVSCTVYGTACAGGIVGKFPAGSTITLKECYSAGSVTAGSSSTTSTYAGGIAGKADKTDSANSSVTITHCSNNATLYAYSKDTGTSGGGTETKTLRDTDGVDLYGAKNVTWNNDVYTISAGGIIGDGGNCTVSYCVNNKTSHTVSSSTYRDYIKYFYGSYGDTTDGVPSALAWYGDFIDITFTQTRVNVREIGFSVSASNCFSSSTGTYYSNSTSQQVYDRLYRVKISGANKNGVTGSQLTLEECVSDPDTSVKYIRETSISSSPTLRLPIGIINNTLYYDDFKSNMCDDVYFYNDNVGTWNKGNVYNLYTTTTSFHQLGLSYVPVTSYNSVTQLYGIYNSNWMSNGVILYGTSFSGEPHYQNLDSKNFYYGTVFASYLNTRFVDSDNDDCPDRYHKEKKAAIKNSKITKTESTSGFTFKHEYGYDYRVAEGFLGLSLNWYTGSGSWDLCTATSRKISNDKSSKTPDTNTIGTLQGKDSNWILKGTTYTFKYLYWSENTSPVK